MECNQESCCKYCPLKPGHGNWIFAVTASLLLHAIVLGALFSQCGKNEKTYAPIPVIPMAKTHKKVKPKTYYQIEELTQTKQKEGKNESIKNQDQEK